MGRPDEGVRLVATAGEVFALLRAEPLLRDTERWMGTDALAGA
jgi:hypothetical protein